MRDTPQETNVGGGDSYFWQRSRNHHHTHKRARRQERAHMHARSHNRRGKSRTWHSWVHVVPAALKAAGEGGEGGMASAVHTTRTATVPGFTSATAMRADIVQQRSRGVTPPPPLISSSPPPLPALTCGTPRPGCPPRAAARQWEGTGHLRRGTPGGARAPMLWVRVRRAGRSCLRGGSGCYSGRAGQSCLRGGSGRCVRFPSDAIHPHGRTSHPGHTRCPKLDDAPDVGLDGIPQPGAAVVAGCSLVVDAWRFPHVVGEVRARQPG
jgi:hypothetical protein